MERTPRTEQPPADVVLVGGTIYTMDPLRPRADGLAIRGDRVVRVGTAAEARALAGPGTRVIDLAGRAVTPGLVDAHCHLMGLGKSLNEVSLRGVASVDAAAEIVARATADRPEGEWITGRGWDQNRWPTKGFPTHEPLDRVSPRHPVALRRIDGHALWANAAAMRAAGITKATKDPPGGKIVRGARGEPTGVFVDQAMALVEDKIPAPAPATLERWILAGAAAATAAGLTGVHEMGIDDATIAAYRRLDAAGRLPLRVYAHLDGEGRVASLAERRPDADPDGTARFVLRAVKLYADGALGSRGAALLAPYRDDPGNKGLVLTPPGTLEEAARLGVAHGWQIAVHAIGDRANRMVLDTYARAGVLPDHRFRIEHVQIVDPADIPRFGRQGVIASMQPTHATSDMPWAEARLGPDRLAGAYAWRSLLAAGARVAAGSDFPVEHVSPLLGLYAFVTRQDAEGRPDGGWLPEQRLTLDEAIHAFTVEPAYAAFAEDHRGRITPGRVADLTVLDRELVPDRSLLETQVDLTIVGGAVVYDRARR